MKDTITPNIEEEVDVESFLNAGNESNREKDGFKFVEDISKTKHIIFDYVLETRDGESVYIENNIIQTNLLELYAGVDDISNLEGKEIPIVKRGDLYSTPITYNPSRFINKLENGFIVFEKGSWVETKKMRKYNKINEKKESIFNNLALFFVFINILGVLMPIYIQGLIIILTILLYNAIIIDYSIESVDIERHYTVLKKIF